MFFCISANPAIDKRLRMPQLRLGAINRATEATPEPGGKAAPVAIPALPPTMALAPRLPVSKSAMCIELPLPRQ